MSAFDMRKHPVHLGLGATAVTLAEFTGQPEWYAAYGAEHAADGNEGRLVTIHTFSESWDTWEMHPQGSELVLCTEGTMTLVQEIDGEHIETVVTAGQAVINEPGVWHTAKVQGQATAVFITAGLGTEMRPV